MIRFLLFLGILLFLFNQITPISIDYFLTTTYEHDLYGVH